MSNVLDKLDAISLDTSWVKLAASVTDKDYRRIVSYDNVTSYSQLTTLHTCPRMFQLDKANAKQPSLPTDDGVQSNVDFAFGHSVGGGVATLIATESLKAGLFAGFISWKADYFATNKKGNKSLAHAQIAIEQFHHQGLADEWEVYLLDDGVPAVEVAFALDCENGYTHYGHIDIILRHKVTQRLAIGEFKTTGYAQVDDASYANSSQGVSYGVVLDSIAPGFSDFEVHYFVYSSASKEWQVLPFTKSLTAKAAYLQDLLLDHSNISTYKQLGFFPQRGESCANQYGRRCKYFGICDLTSHAKEFVDLPAGTDAENVHFKFKLSELVAQQRSNNYE